MANFEEIGRVVDREMEELRQFFNQEVKPVTQRRLAEALRAASKHLGELAHKLEERMTEPASQDAADSAGRK
jgi:hypothetical protein